MDKLRQLWNVSYPDKRLTTQTLITPSASPPISRTPSRQRTLPPDQPSPAKKPRIALTPSSSSTLSSSSNANDRNSFDFEQARRDSALRLRDSWSALAERYTRRLDEDDIIDLRSIKLYKDRGVVRGSSGETRFGFMSVPDEPEPSNDASSEGGGAQTEGEEDDDEIDALGAEGVLEGTLGEKLRRAMPPRGRDPFDDDDLKEFMEAEKRRQAEFGNLDDDSDDDVHLRELVDQESRTYDKSEPEPEVEDGVSEGGTDGEDGEDNVSVLNLGSGSSSDSEPEVSLAQVARDRGKAALQKKKITSQPSRSGVVVAHDSEDELGGWDHDESTAIYRLAKDPAPEVPRAKSKLPPDVEVIEIFDTPSPSPPPSPASHPEPMSPPPISPIRFSPVPSMGPPKPPPPLFSQSQLQTPPQSSSSTSDYTPAVTPLPDPGPSSHIPSHVSKSKPRPKPKPKPVHKGFKPMVDVPAHSVASSSSSSHLNSKVASTGLTKKSISHRSSMPEVLITTKPPGKRLLREGTLIHANETLSETPLSKYKVRRRPTPRTSPSPPPLPRPLPPRSPWLDRKGKGRAYPDDEAVETHTELSASSPPASKLAIPRKATSSPPPKTKKHSSSKKWPVAASSSPSPSKSAPSRKRKRVSSPPDASPEPSRMELSRTSVESTKKSPPVIVRSTSPTSSSDERDRQRRHRSRSRGRGRSQSRGKASPDEEREFGDKHSRSLDTFYPPPSQYPAGYGGPLPGGHPGPPYPPVDGAQAQYMLAQAIQQISYLIGSVGMPPNPPNGEHPPWPPPGAPPGQYHTPYPPRWPAYPPPHTYREQPSSSPIESASSSRRPSSFKTPTHRFNHPLYTPSSSHGTLPPSSPYPDEESSPPPSARSKSRARSKSVGRRVSFKLDERPHVGHLLETDVEENNEQEMSSSPSIVRGRSRSMQRGAMRKGGGHARAQERERTPEAEHARGRIHR